MIPMLPDVPYVGGCSQYWWMFAMLADCGGAHVQGSLGAAQVVINTDVPGVMTADPGIVKDAVPVRNLTYSEALELAVYGARSVHPSACINLVAELACESYLLSPRIT
jgi:uridylate kinase